MANKPKLRYEGFKEMRGKLRSIERKGGTFIKPVASAHFKDERGRLKGRGYPPKPSGSIYKRTGRLANSWSFKEMSGYKWALANSAKYSAWVVGERDGQQPGQTTVHKRNGWWVAIDVVQERIQDLLDKLGEAYANWWSS